MGELKYNSAYPQVNGAYPTPYKLAGVGAQTPNFGGILNMNIGDYLSTLPATTQTPQFSGMSSISPQQLFMASGIEIAPTLGSTGNFSDGGFNRDLFNTPDSSSGNPLGLKLGAKTDGESPKIAMPDKINAGVGVFNAALDAISAYKALKLGKENLAFQKDSFNRNFEAMKGTTNAELADRQARRVRYDAQNGLNNNLSVAEYMAKYGVK